MKIIIPSRHRVELAQRCQKYFPGSYVCVADEEYKDYKEYCSNIIVHPNNVCGTGPIHQWILDNEPEPVVTVDDDVTGLVCLTDMAYRKIEPGKAWLQIVENLQQMADNMHVNVFGFNQAWDVRKYNPLKPFSLCGWVGGVIGVNYRDVRYSQNLLLREDVDFCLQNLLQYRIVLIDNRFSFVQDRSMRTGGNDVNRSQERDEAERKYLKEKWGKYIELRPKITTIETKLKVDRSFKIKI